MTQTVTVNGASSVIYNDFSPPLTVVGASIPAALTDQGSGTYIETGNDVSGTIAVTVPTPTLPPRAIVQYIQFVLKRYLASGVDNSNPFFVRQIGGLDAAGNPHGSTMPPSFTPAMLPLYPAVYTVKTGQFSQFADGLHVKDMQTTGLAVWFFVYPGSVPGAMRLQDIQTIWTYNTPPSITVTGPVDPSVTSKPDVTWTYSDVDGDPQRAARVIVVPDGTVSTKTPFGYAGDTGYDPTGATVKSFDSGKVFTSATTMTCTGGLVNGGNYWAYVMVWSDPVAGQDQTSTWQATQFSVNVTPPVQPYLTIATDQPNARVLLEASESLPASTPHPDRFDIERSDDDGATWVPVRNAEFTGTSYGARNAGTAGVGWGTADRSNFLFGDGVRIRWHGNLTGYSPGAIQTLVDQAAAGQRCFRFEVDATGHLQFVWSTDKTNWDQTATSSVTVAAGNSLPGWFEVQAVLSTNPWTVTFKESTDGVTWTTLGSVRTGTGPKRTMNSTAGLNIDGTAAHASQNLNGVTYDIDVWNEAGTKVAEASWVGLAPNTASFYDPYGNLWQQQGTGGWLAMRLALYDYEATPNVVLRYRARSWRDDPPADVAVSEWVEGHANETASMTTDSLTEITDANGDALLAILLVGDAAQYILPAVQWRIKDPLEPSLNFPVTVSEWVPEKVKVSAVAEGLESHRALVTHGGMRGDRIAAKFRTTDKTVYDELLAALSSGRTLLVQGVLGGQWYVQPVNGVSRTQMLSQRQVGELFPVRHAFEIDAQFVEVEVP